MSEIVDGTEMARMVRAGEASAAELVEAAIARAEQVNGELNAIIHPLYDKARASAAHPLPQHASGPFAGVPFLTKDLMCATEGDPYHAGNKALRDANSVAPYDTHLATMFADAGLVNIGRTNTPEFGGTITTEPASHGPCRNPWNTAHSTGGSSGGSAASVAAGVVPIAHANDGGGSIRIPASECGLFGLKPSRGRVSHGPDHGEAWGGAAIEGVVSRTVRDSATMLDAISRVWPGDPYHAPAPPTPFADAPHTDPGKLKVGLLTASSWGPVHQECATAVEHTGRVLESLGHSVEYAAPEAIFNDNFFDHFRTVLAVAIAAEVTGVSRRIGRQAIAGDFEADTWALAQLGTTISGTDYLAAIEQFQQYTRDMSNWWATGHDLLVTPVIAEPPPLIGELRNPATGRARQTELLKFTAQFNVTGQPAMSVPMHWTPDDLPVGVQVVGAYASEHQLLSVAAQLEAAAPWAHRRPGVFAS
ncbi:MAG: amidase [Candidatus Poriferisodalaceae bacterium]|jgi:amidase